MKIAISTESVCDLRKEQIEEHGIKIVPYHVILGDDEYSDGENITSDVLFDYVNKTGVLPKTSALTVGEYEDHFNSILKEYDAVIHISLSSKITSSITNCQMAVKNCPNTYLIDSKSLSSGVGLLCLSCADKIQAGKDLKKIINELTDEAERVQASFIINNLKYLHKGGRCSSLALLGSNLLNIKPMIALSDGKMIVQKKYMGKHETVLLKYCEDVLSSNNPDLTRAFVTYSSRVDVADKLVQRLKQFGFKEVFESSAGCTICSHCGPATMGVLFINKEKNEN